MFTIPDYSRVLMQIPKDVLSRLFKSAPRVLATFFLLAPTDVKIGHRWPEYLDPAKGLKYSKAIFTLISRRKKHLLLLACRQTKNSRQLAIVGTALPVLIPGH